MEETCKYVFPVGKNKGLKCMKKNLYDGYCLHHRRVIDEQEKKVMKFNDTFLQASNHDSLRRLPSTSGDQEYIGGSGNKGFVKGAKSSLFFITINSNIPYRDMSENQKEKFKLINKYLYEPTTPTTTSSSSRTGKWKDLIIYDITSDKKFQHPNLIDYKIRYTFEVGRKNPSLHTHCMIYLYHTGHYIYDGTTVRKFVNEIFGQNVHIHIRASNANEFALQKYIEKLQ
jgi:hypothetical protein